MFGMALVALREQGLDRRAPDTSPGLHHLVVVFLIPAEGDVYLRPLFRVANILVGAPACLIVSLLAA